MNNMDYAREILASNFESRSLRKFLKTVIYRNTEARLGLDPCRTRSLGQSADPRHPHSDRVETRCRS